MADELLRGTADSLRFFAVNSTETIRTAFAFHHPSWAAGIVLGRVLTATLMMGMDLKNETDAVTLKLALNGPLGGALATAHNDGTVKGYINHPNTPGDNVPEAVGGGILTVIKDMGLAHPYSGEVELVRNDIANDLAHYYMLSEQTPTAIGLGVVPEEDGSARHAGGFIIQLLPNTPESVISALETNIGHMPQLADMLDLGYSIEKLVMEIALKGLHPQIHERKPCRFSCDCSKERFEKGIILLGKQELRELAANHEPVEVECHFCNRRYSFSPEEITAMLMRAK